MEIWRQQYLGLETVPPSLTNAEIDFFLHLLTRRGRSLSAVDLIPVPVLACAAKHADIPALQIATLRTIYCCPKTLFAHQKIAADAAGLKPYSDQVSRHVTGFLRRQAGSVISRDELTRDARLWRYNHGYMLPRQRTLERLSAEAQTYALKRLRQAFVDQIQPVKTMSWASELAAAGPNAGEALLDWLRGATGGFGYRDISEAQDRIDELRRLGAAAAAPCTLAS